MNDQQSRISPAMVWVVALGAAASGVSGVGNMGQLNSLNSAVEEQIRVAEMRGQLMAEIAANRDLIDANQVTLQKMIPKEGVLQLHAAQQVLIERLIDWTDRAVTKNELQLAIGKMREITGSEEK